MNLPDKCPFCGAGILIMENGEKCVSENLVAFQCITSIHAGQDIRLTQSRECETNERIRVAELEARCKWLEAIVNDPQTLWANWLRGNIRLPVGIGDVRHYQDRIKRLEEALDTLTLVVGLTPIAGNKDALQEALDLARRELKANKIKL